MANWYVRKGGSDSNGGSSISLTPERSGSDGVGNASTTFTSATAVFTAGDVGKGINISATLYRIAGFTNATTITLDRTLASGSARPWAIGGALASVTKFLNLTVTTVVQAGDTIWVGAGVYREIVTPGVSFTVTPVTLRGDVDGAMTGDAGEVRFSCYLTNDKTTPSVSPSITGIKNFWTFRNLTFITGSGNPNVMSLGNATDVSFINCVFLAAPMANLPSIGHTVTTAAARNILFDGCLMFLPGSWTITLPTSSIADYDANIVMRNCVVWSTGIVPVVISSGALAFKGGGIYLFNNTLFVTAQPAIQTNSASLSSTFPMRVENNVIVGGIGSTALNANTLGQIVEDYNVIYAGTPRANVTAGANSKSDGSYALLMSIGQERIWGGQPRLHGTPLAGSPLLGFGNSASAGVPATDALGAARPAGGASALKGIGAYERGNTWGRETTTVRTGANALSITGPGYQDFLVPVDASSTTVGIYVRWDATYAGTKPALQVLNGTQAGVANATATAVGSSGAWEQLTLTFTPTAKGIVTVRLLSSDTNGAGKAFADDWSIT